jgi:phage shock protein A
MGSKKHVKKVKVAPRTDANQGVREHIERVRKQNEYIVKKIAEYKAKQEVEMQRRQAELGEHSTATIDGLAKGDSLE